MIGDIRSRDVTHRRSGLVTQIDFCALLWSAGRNVDFQYDNVATEPPTKKRSTLFDSLAKNWRVHCVLITARSLNILRKCTILFFRVPQKELVRTIFSHHGVCSGLERKPFETNLWGSTSRTRKVVIKKLYKL